MSEWQPISTAPNGVYLLASRQRAGMPLIGMMLDDGEFAAYDQQEHGFGRPYKPTHWMPLPEPPDAGGE